MHTEHVNILLPDFVRGQLGGEQTAAVEEHLRSCQVCSSNLAELKNTLAILEQSHKKDLSKVYFSSILPRVHQRLERDKKKEWISKPFVNKILLPLGAAAVLLVVLMRLPSGWETLKSENPLQAVVSLASADEIAEILQEDIPLQGVNSLNSAILTSALSDEQFVQRRLVSEALNSETTSPFNVFADVTPQQVLNDLEGPEADRMLQRLQQMEIL